MLSPQTAALLRDMAALAEVWGPRLATGGIAESRAFAAAAFKAFAGRDRDVPGAAVTDLTVGGGDGPRPARLYRPPGPTGAALPVVVFLHGGGWALGDLDSYDGLMRSMAALSGAVFVAVDYRLAPEHPFPAGLDDAVACVRWVAGQADALGVDAARLAVMGDSAGGNLATCAAHALLRAGGPKVAAQYLIYPMTDVSRPHTDYPSRQRFGDGDLFLTRAAIDAARQWYIGDDPRLAVDPRVSPMRAEDLTSMPPTYAIVAGLDPLRDEAIAYCERLKSASVTTEVVEFEEAIHGLLSFGILDEAQDARRTLARMISH